MTRMTGPDCVVMCNLINTYIRTYIHTYLHTYIHIYIVSWILPWEDQCEWHKMTKMTGPDSGVMCNYKIYMHTYIRITYILMRVA